MTPFILEIWLRSPIILGRRLMLDSLLIGIARERFGDDAIHNVLIARTHTIPNASQMLAGTPDIPIVRSTTYIQSFIRVLSDNPTMTDMLIKQPPPSSMNYGSGPNSNIESEYTTYNIPRVYFLGVGDVPRIRKLLLTLVCIGAMAHKGNGEVERTEIIEIDADPTWFGIVGCHHDQLTVLRPVPKRMQHLLPPGTAGIDNDETWDYPYFPRYPTAVVEPCLVPPFTTNSAYFHGEDIQEMIKGTG